MASIHRLFVSHSVPYPPSTSQPSPTHPSSHISHTVSLLSEHDKTRQESRFSQTPAYSGNKYTRINIVPHHLTQSHTTSSSPFRKETPSGKRNTLYPMACNCAAKYSTSIFVQNVSPPGRGPRAPVMSCLKYPPEQAYFSRAMYPLRPTPTCIMTS